MSNCIKTGCSVFLEEYGGWAYGDAFKFDDLLIFRLVALDHTKPINDSPRHFTVRLIDHWWDDRRTSQEINSTLVAYAQHVVNHGYEGVPDGIQREVQS